MEKLLLIYIKHTCTTNPELTDLFVIGDLGCGKTCILCNPGSVGTGLNEVTEKKPLGIKIIGCALIIFAFNMIGQSFIYETFPSSKFVEESQRESYNTLFKVAIGAALFTILVISSIGLFFRKRYARRLTEIIAILMIIAGISILVNGDGTGITALVIGVIIILYFRQKNTQRYFRSIADDKK